MRLYKKSNSRLQDVSMFVYFFAGIIDASLKIIHLVSHIFFSASVSVYKTYQCFFYFFAGIIDASLQMPDGNKSNESNESDALRFIL